MRVITAFLVLAACGRVGFEPQADGGNSPDVPPTCTGPDEDGDGWPDACDNCLTEPNPDQRDRGELDAGAGADGVGDACDPRPTVDGDYLVIADTFDAANPAYTYSGVSTYPGNGRLRLGDVAGNGKLGFSTPLTVSRVDMILEVHALSTTQQSYAGFWVDEGVGREKVFSHGAHPAGAPALTFTLKEQTEPSGDAYSAGLPYPLQPGQVTRYRLITDTTSVTGGDWRLRVTDLANDVQVTTTLAIAIPRGSGGFLESDDMLVEIPYLVIYAIR